MQWAKNDLHIFASLLCKVLLCAQLIKLWVSGIEVKVRRCVEVRTNKAMREFVWSVAAALGLMRKHHRRIKIGVLHKSCSHLIV